MFRKYLSFLLLSSTLLPLSVAYPQPLFDTWTTYWTGHNTSSVFVEDLNGDGHLDLAVANSYWKDSSVSILINTGNGTFASKQDYAVSPSSFFLFAYDLDGDGDMDLAAASGYPDSVVSVLKNNGNGTFSPKVSYSAGTSPGMVWVADLDGDLDGDLVISGGWRYTRPKNIFVLKNNGDGTFGAPTNYIAGNNPTSLITSDIDGDGDLDIITANTDAWADSSEIVSILKNNGDGTFANKIQLGIDSSSLNNPISLCASDFDGDGDQDLAVAIQRDPNSEISIFKNEGGGNFGPRTSYIVGKYPHSICAADLDGDGYDDLAVAYSYYTGAFGEIAVLKNNGDGTFAPRIDYPAGETPLSLKVKDIDNDGSKDIIFVTYGYDGGASILKNKGDGTFPIRSDYGVGASPNEIVASDLDGDGDNDLGIANSLEYSVSLLRNDGNGTFQPKVNFNTNGYPASIFASDINGDGYRDLLTAQPNTGSFSVLSNDGNAGFNTRSDYSGSSGPNLVASSDLDGDGDQDVVTASYNGYGFAVFKNEGGGALGPPVGYDPGYPTYEISLSDLDQDGDMDLARPWWGVYKNNGDGTFGNVLSLPAGGCPASVSTSDLDKDGDADWVSLHPCSPYFNDNYVSVYLNNGDASFAPNVNHYAGPWTAEYPYDNRMAAADMNGDGNNDLIFTNIYTRTVSILTNNGNGTFGPPIGYGVGVHPHSVVASDLDGDGDIDLAVTNDSSNTVSILINQTNTCIKLGDVNHDCVLAVNDVIMQLNCVFSGLGNCPLNITDTNCDGRLTPTDIILLLYAVFLNTPLNCP